MASVEIPNGISVEVKGGAIVTKGALGVNERRFNSALLEAKVSGSKLTINPVNDRKLAKKAAKAAQALAGEAQNDIAGVTKYFETSMEAVFAHFPMTLEVKGPKLMIKNMFGERAPRSADIVGNTKIEIKDKSVRIYGTKLDDVGQTAANIRTACKVRNKDVRVFQDGIYHVA